MLLIQGAITVSDYGIYIEEAAKAGLKIIWALETHRHEDQISGAAGLAKACGAKAGYSRYEDLGQTFGTPIGEEDIINLGELVRVRPIHTPGHTLGSLSFVVEYNKRPMYVITGDTLFFGGVGRTDFYGESNLKKMTTLLHESLYQKIAPLGDDVIVLPGHGAGSACGNDLDEIEDSTLGREFSDSKALSEDLDTFISLHGRMYFKNPAFSKMEVVNVEGAGDYAPPPRLLCFEVPDEARIIDVRDRFAYTGTHLPHAHLVPAELTANYVGWQCGTEEALCLVRDGLSEDQVELAWATLYRTGFDEALGCLPDGILRYNLIMGNTLPQLKIIAAKDYLAMDKSENSFTLDVRLPEEFDAELDVLHNRVAIPLQELKQRMAEVPAEGTLYLLCGSGERATVAAGMIDQPDRIQVISGGIHSVRNLLA